MALRPGGVTAFTVIEPAPGLTPAERRRVADVGPSDVLVRTGYPSLLDSAGFVDVAADDVTSDYRATLSAWIRETDRRAADVEAVVGAEELEARQRRRIGALAAVDAGILRRTAYRALRRR